MSAYVTRYYASGSDWKVAVEDWRPHSLGLRIEVQCCSWGGDYVSLDVEEAREFAAALEEAARVVAQQAAEVLDR